MKYSIWNNKGGVGKSFLTFCLATEYAIAHPEKFVAIADLCPQANVSEMLLGGNGKGEANLAALCDSGSTIAGYIKERFLSGNRYEKLGSELQYFIKVSEYNGSIPANLFLLPGDIDLDLASKLVAVIERDPVKEAASRAMSMLKDILSVFEGVYKKENVTIFIDCNPSFAIYTELAMFASDRLIVPCTGDFASLRGVDNVTKLLYGMGRKDEKESMFDIINFHEKAARVKLNVPELYLGIMNKSRTKKKDVTAAYQAHVKEIEKRFSGLQSPVQVMNVKDCNNVSLVVNYTGMPISKLEHKKYSVYGKSTQVNGAQLGPIRENITEIIAKLQGGNPNAE